MACCMEVDSHCLANNYWQFWQSLPGLLLPSSCWWSVCRRVRLDWGWPNMKNLLELTYENMVCMELELTSIWSKTNSLPSRCHYFRKNDRAVIPYSIHIFIMTSTSFIFGIFRTLSMVLIYYIRWKLKAKRSAEIRQQVGEINQKYRILESSCFSFKMRDSTMKFLWM